MGVSSSSRATLASLTSATSLACVTDALAAPCARERRQRGIEKGMVEETDGPSGLSESSAEECAGMGGVGGRAAGTEERSAAEWLKSTTSALASSSALGRASMPFTLQTSRPAQRALRSGRKACGPSLARSAVVVVEPTRTSYTTSGPSTSLASKIIVRRGSNRRSAIMATCGTG